MTTRTAKRLAEIVRNDLIVDDGVRWIVQEIVEHSSCWELRLVAFDGTGRTRTHLVGSADALFELGHESENVPAPRCAFCTGELIGSEIPFGTCGDCGDRNLRPSPWEAIESVDFRKVPPTTGFALFVADLFAAVDLERGSSE